MCVCLCNGRYAARPLLARVLCDYLIYTEHNMKKALELCALATQVSDFQVRFDAAIDCCIDIDDLASLGHTGVAKSHAGLHSHTSSVSRVA